MTETAAPIEQPASPQSTRNRRTILALIVLTVACYWPVGKFDFINYDDPRYFSENRHVVQGLNWETFKWSWTTSEVGYRHPLSWWSHLIDVSLFGLNPGPHHMVSMVLHAAAVCLLWWVLLRMTGAFWPSVWVAAIFAVHPTHLESVAWLAERKDVLSVLFMLLTFWAYIVYTERPGAKTYAVVVIAFIGALLAKPMMVTIPVLLLLLDVWPLRRLQAGKGIGRLLLEKMPLLALSGVVTAVTITDSRDVATLIPLDLFPLPFRIQTFLVLHVRYLGKLLWPTHLSIFYPYPSQGWPMIQVVLSATTLAAIVALVIWQAKRRPYLLVGFLFFVVAISPVNGLIPNGDASLGDRYLYAPSIGLTVALAWLARDLGRRFNARTVVASLGVASVVACTVLSSIGVWHWQNSLTIMAHAMNVTENNWVAHINYGQALKAAGKPKEACPYFAKALQMYPRSRDALINHATCLVLDGNLEEAVPLVNKALAAEPKYAPTWVLAGQFEAARGRHREAIAHFRKALQISSFSDTTHRLLAYSLFNTGQIDEGEKHLREALAINPDNPDAYHRLGLIADQRRKPEEALRMFENALNLDPNLAVARVAYGIQLAKVGRFNEAQAELQKGIDALPADDAGGRSQAETSLGLVFEKLGRPMEGAQHYLKAADYAQAAVGARPGDPLTHFQLALALRQTSQAEAARTAAAKALELATQRNNQYLVRQLLGRFPELAAATRPTTSPATRP